MSVKYVLNEQEKPVQVLLNIMEYEELLERVEDIEAVAMLEDIKRSTREHISLDDLTTNLGVNV